MGTSIGIHYQKHKNERLLTQGPLILCGNQDASGAMKDKLTTAKSSGMGSPMLPINEQEGFFCTMSHALRQRVAIFAPE